MTTLTIAWTAIKTFFGKLPTWLWIVIIAVITLYATDRRARSIQREEDAAEFQARIDSMMAHPDTAYVMMPVVLPKPKPAAPIPATDLELPEEVEKELADLRKAKMETDIKISEYEKIIKQRSTVWSSRYEDSVQTLTMTVNPYKRTVMPEINYKEPYCWIPVVNYTLPPKPVEWWRSPTAKTIYGIVGAGLVYNAIDKDDDYRLWKAIAGTGMLTLSFGL